MNFFYLLLLPFICFAQIQTKEQAAKVKFEKGDVLVGRLKIKAEFAETSEQQEVGLMFREKLQSGEGMLFVFSREEILNFWMKNTLIPLSVGFFDSNKKLIKIRNMVPASPMDNSPAIYSSGKPALYALEVPQGWFEKNKINLGEKFSLVK